MTLKTLRSSKAKLSMNLVRQIKTTKSRISENIIGNQFIVIDFQKYIWRLSQHELISRQFILFLNVQYIVGNVLKQRYDNSEARKRKRKCLLFNEDRMKTIFLRKYLERHTQMIILFIEILRVKSLRRFSAFESFVIVKRPK